MATDLLHSFQVFGIHAGLYIYINYDNFFLPLTQNFANVQSQSKDKSEGKIQSLRNETPINRPTVSHYRDCAITHTHSKLHDNQNFWTRMCRMI